MSTEHGSAAPGTAGPTATGGNGPWTQTARELLAGLDDAPLAEHVSRIDELHRRLAAALEEPAPGRPGPPRPLPGS